MKDDEIYEKARKSGYFTAQELHEYIDSRFFGNRTDTKAKKETRHAPGLRAVQQWLEKYAYPRVDGKKPLEYSFEDYWDLYIRTHRIKWISRNEAQLEKSEFSRKLEKEWQEQVSKWNQIPEGYTFGEDDFYNDVYTTAKSYFEHDQVVFLLKKILDSISSRQNVSSKSRKEELNETKLFDDEKQRAEIELLGYSNRSLADDKLLERIKDYRNYF